MIRQALNYAVGRQLIAGPRFLPGQDFLPHLAACQVELPFDQLHAHQPMIAALGQPDFRQLGVETLFAKAVGRLAAPAMNNRLVPLSGRAVGATREEVKAGRRPQLWAVVIGVSRYEHGDQDLDGNQISNLK